MLLDLIFSLMKRIYLNVPNEISQAQFFFLNYSCLKINLIIIFNFKSTFPIVG